MSIESTETVLFDKSVSCNDVQQGELGDCYFISALSIIVRINSQ